MSFSFILLTLILQFLKGESEIVDLKPFFFSNINILPCGAFCFGSQIGGIGATLLAPVLSGVPALHCLVYKTSV